MLDQAPVREPTPPVDLPPPSTPAERGNPLMRWVLHPFGFASYPVLALYAANADRREFRPFIGPLLVALAATALLVVVGRWIFRDTRKAAFAASVAIFALVAYGPVYNAVRGNEINGVVVGRDLYLLPTALALVIIGLVYAFRAKGGIAVWTVFLNIFAVVLLITPVQQIVTHVVSEPPSLPRRSDSEFASLLQQTSGADRDIYYIVLDKYPGAKTLRDHMAFDNTPFLDRLRDRGFYVAAEESMANYHRTSYALSTSLNMEYINDYTDRLGTNDESLMPVLKLIERNRVARILKGMGYRYVHIGSSWQPTASNPLADENVPYAFGSDVSRALLQGTAAFRANKHVGWLDDVVDPWRVYWHGTSGQFGHVKRVAEMDEPTFTFAHILVPHDPYIFDRDGSYISRREQKSRPYREKFTDQLVFANHQVIDMVDHLLDVPADEQPIIIIQSDEGPVPGGVIGKIRWPQASERQLQFKFRILSAYHFPGVDTSELYQQISPVNSFRMLFNLYHDADLELLPDRSYLPTKIYDFIDITDRIVPPPSEPPDDDASQPASSRDTSPSNEKT
jgi:hypothetical protein